MSQEHLSYPRKAIFFSLSTPGWENKLFANYDDYFFGGIENQYEFDLIGEEIIDQQEFELKVSIGFAKKLLPDQVEDIGHCETLKQLTHKVFTSSLNLPNIPKSFLKKILAKIALKSNLKTTFKENGPCAYAIIDNRKSLQTSSYLVVNNEATKVFGREKLDEWLGLEVLGFLRYVDDEDDEVDDIDCDSTEESDDDKNRYLSNKLFPGAIKKDCLVKLDWPPSRIMNDDLFLKWAIAGCGAATYQDQYYFKYTPIDDDDYYNDDYKLIFKVVAYGRHADEFVPIKDYTFDISHIRYIMGFTSSYWQERARIYRRMQKLDLIKTLWPGREKGLSREEILSEINQKHETILKEQEIEEVVDAYDPFMAIEIEEHKATIKSKMRSAYPDRSFYSDFIKNVPDKESGFNRYCVPVIVASVMIGVKPETVRRRFHKNKLGGFKDCDQIYIWLDGLLKSN